MKRPAAKRETTSRSVHNEMQQFVEAQSARAQFLSATMNMGWRLFITVVVPIVAGVKLDERFNSAPSLTLLGFMVAALAGCAAVWGTVKQVNQQQADDNVKLKNIKRRIKRA